MQFYRLSEVNNVHNKKIINYHVVQVDLPNRIQVT